MKILDHGYLRVVEAYGSDKAIVEAARMSTQKGFLGWGPKDCEHCGNRREIPSQSGHAIGIPCGQCPPGDEKLLRYLYENKHATPFEMAGMIIEVKAPILVFREWHRHRTQSYNEMSARYTPLPNENYTPTVERLMINAGGTNKQAGTIAGAETLTLDAALEWLDDLADVYERIERVYQKGLAIGVPKELARCPVPVARYSSMRASANLRNWLGFLVLRADPKAQWEIRQYANALGNILAEYFPRTMALFQEGQAAR